MSCARKLLTSSSELLQQTVGRRGVSRVEVDCQPTRSLTPLEYPRQKAYIERYDSGGGEEGWPVPICSLFDVSRSFSVSRQG